MKHKISFSNLKWNFMFHKVELVTWEKKIHIKFFDLVTWVLMPSCITWFRNSISRTSRSLWNYYRDKIDDIDVNDNALDGKSFEYKTKIVEGTPGRPPQPGNQGCRLTSTASRTIVQLRSHYSSQLSWQFLEIFWFTFDELWSKAYSILDTVVKIKENVLTRHKFTNLLKSVSPWGVTMIDESFEFLTLLEKTSKWN